MDYQENFDYLVRGLVAGASQLGLSLTEREIAAIAEYGLLIQKWNKVYNLTSKARTEEILVLHLLDVLAIVPYFGKCIKGISFCDPLVSDKNKTLRVLDIGSGAGLPGVILAILFPELKIICVDAVQKKITFLTHVRTRLSLVNLQAEHGRIENIYPLNVNIVVSRAFAEISAMVSLTQQHLCAGGHWLAMKGRGFENEVANLVEKYAVFHVEQLLVPGLDAQRFLLDLRDADV